MDETIAMVKQLLRGVDLSPTSLALDVIHEVGPGGTFFSTEHTLQHYRETWYPDLIDRTCYADWEREGKRTLGERANRKAIRILEGHRPEPLPARAAQRIAEILQRSR
jgi:trimethylamine--corrinoid protein Co-methyltransferase